MTSTCLIHESFYQSHRFVDFNECSENRTECDQLCINVPGSFLCSCIAGYILNDDGMTCRGTCSTL